VSIGNGLCSITLLAAASAGGPDSEKFLFEGMGIGGENITAALSGKVSRGTLSVELIRERVEDFPFDRRGRVRRGSNYKRPGIVTRRPGRPMGNQRGLPDENDLQMIWD